MDCGKTQDHHQTAGIVTEAEVEKYCDKVLW
jgi:hypothetical protein